MPKDDGNADVSQYLATNGKYGGSCFTHSRAAVDGQKVHIRMESIPRKTRKTLVNQPVRRRYLCDALRVSYPAKILFDNGYRGTE
jgi:hypothetical protein